jgi:uncharacterized protein YndB with AHSA1/START domain
MAEVRLEVDLAHPRDRVWRALTDARLLSDWLMPTDLAAREGAEFTLEPGTLAGFLGPVSAELTELVPPHRMVMLWQGEKLHTRMVWELTETDSGCTLQLVQTGFIGAPATLRRRALRDTYARLFAERLPLVLDRLAAVPLLAGSGAELGGPVAPAATVPRQRKGPVNVAIGAWAAGRSLGGPADPGSPDPALPSAGVAPAPAVPRPRPAADAEQAAAPREPERRSRLAWLDRWGAAPGWVRAAGIAGAGAVLAVAVLAAVVYTPGSDAGEGGSAAGPEAERDNPGVAQQPGGRTSQTEPEPSGAVAPGMPPSEAPGSSNAPSQAGAGDSEAMPGDAGTPAEGTAAPSPLGSSPPPVLTAQMTASDQLLLGLGGRAVTVTVSNPGPADADGWEVAMDVGDQDVTNVSGADYARDGSQALFTPLEAELPAGTSTQFSFDLPGLLGASDPTGCTIDGQPCG